MNKPSDRSSVNFKKYTYTGFRDYGIKYVQVGGLIGMSFFIFFGIVLFIINIIIVPSNEEAGWINDPRLTAMLLSVFMIFMSWFTGGMLINFFPTIWVNDDGIRISHFLFFKVFIPWNEVVDVMERKSWFYPMTLVLAKRITVFHRIASLFYFHTSDPCFVIGEEIEDRATLISFIRSKSLFHSKYYAENLKDV